jgi:hypothetical protein
VYSKRKPRLDAGAFFHCVFGCGQIIEIVWMRETHRPPKLARPFNLGQYLKYFAPGGARRHFSNF